MFSTLPNMFSTLPNMFSTLPNCSECRHKLYEATPTFAPVEEQLSSATAQLSSATAQLRKAQWTRASDRLWPSRTDSESADSSPSSSPSSPSPPYPHSVSYVGRECQRVGGEVSECKGRIAATDAEVVDVVDCGAPSRFGTIAALEVANPGMVDNRGKNYEIAITPGVVASFLLDSGLLALTWAGLALGLKNLSVAQERIYSNFVESCNQISERAGKFVVFRDMGPTFSKLVPQDLSDTIVARVVHHFYEFRKDGFYVNFAANHLGGGVAGPTYMLTTGKGWGQEETLTFQQNIMPLISQTQSSAAAWQEGPEQSSYSNLLLGLNVCPVILRTSVLFGLKNPLLGLGGRRKLIDSYIRGEVKISKPSFQRRDGTFGGMPIYWICMASPDMHKRPHKNNPRAAIQQMYGTALWAFEQAYFRWISSYDYELSGGNAAMEPKLEINTGLWGGGYFGVQVSVSVAVQYLAAHEVKRRHQKSFCPIHLIFHATGSDFDEISRALAVLATIPDGKETLVMEFLNSVQAKRAGFEDWRNP
jgi:hypothetical protein